MRHLRRTLAVAALALAASLTGCSATTASHPSADAKHPHATTTPAPSSPSGTTTPVACDHLKPVHGATAIARYGKAAVNAAYCQMVNYSLTTSYRADLATPRQHRTFADFSWVSAAMVPALRPYWRKDVTAYLTSHTRKTLAPVDGLTLTDANYWPGYTFRPGKPAAVAQTYSPATASVVRLAGHRYLQLAFTTTADLVLTRHHTVYGVPVHKTVRLAVTPTGHGRWLIGSWYGYLHMAGHPRKLTQLTTAGRS